METESLWLDGCRARMNDGDKFFFAGWFMTVQDGIYEKEACLGFLLNPKHRKNAKSNQGKIV